MAQYCKEKDLQVCYIRCRTLYKVDFPMVEGGDGGNCKIGNRLRLTANGKLKRVFLTIWNMIRKIGFEQVIKMALKTSLNVAWRIIIIGLTIIGG
ncbi:MAG: hypothetical protein RR356_06590 [Bacteroidales bacterium]